MDETTSEGSGDCRLPIVMGIRPAPGAARAVGLALTFADGQFVVEVCADDGEVLLSLGSYREDDVVAVWRSLAASSGLPLLTRGPDGVLQQPYRQIGRLVVGDGIDRRRMRVLSGRRPRFLVKRKPGRMPRRPFVYRERELATGATD